MTSIKWTSIFVAGMFAGAVGGAGVVATAAPGDLIYRVNAEPVKITTLQAAGLADAFIAVGAWNGLKADMIHCQVYRNSDGGFGAGCSGLKKAAPSALPITEQGIQVVGVAQ